MNYDFDRVLRERVLGAYNSVRARNRRGSYISPDRMGE
jgi:hypothetical protein